MIYRFIQKNTLAPLVLLPFIMVAFWSKALFIPSSDVVVSSTPMPLFELVHRYFTGHNIYTPLMTLFLAFIVILGLNRLNSRHVLLKRQNILIGLIFLIFSSGYPLVQQLLEIWFFLPFCIFSIDRLFVAASKNEASVDIFNTFFLLAIGTLFFGKGVFFIPAFFWALLMLNLLTIRNVFAALIGTFTPYFFSFGVFVLLNREGQFFGHIYENIVSSVPFFTHNIFSKIYNGLLVALVLVSILFTVSMLNTMKIISRKLFNVLIMLVMYGILLAATPFYSIEIIPLIGLGGAIMITNFLDNIRSTFYKELIFTLLVVVTIMIQFLS